MMSTEEPMEEDCSGGLTSPRVPEFGGYELRPRPVASPSPGTSSVVGSPGGYSSVNLLASPHHASTWPRKSGRVRRCTLRGVGDVGSFPFARLPAPAKQRVFEKLGLLDKGTGQRVCREWRDELRRNILWTAIDFTALPPCYNHSAAASPAACTDDCYAGYQRRVRSFVQFLCRIRPKLRALHFEFDLREPGAEWKKLVEQLLCQVDCSQLTYLHMNWKHTAAFPCRMMPEKVQDRNYRQRLRQRSFMACLDQVAQQCPNIQTLLMPFEWSSRSIETLSRLQHIHTLALEKYDVFKTLTQETLNSLLQAMPQLRRLGIEVVTPSAHEMVPFSLAHPHLEYLDVSQCRGLYVNALHTPGLTCFKIGRHPWSGYFTARDDSMEALVCVHQVLVRGAPRLQKLNELTLAEDWGVRTCAELEDALRAVCSCRRHRSHWHM